MRRCLRFVGLFFALFLLQAEGQFKVAVLHPLLGDAARQVGGDDVEVVELIGENDDPHRFQPSAKALKLAHGAGLYLLMGKGMEPYADNLKEILGAGRVLELGESVPSLMFQAGQEFHSCCAHHANHGAVDPHWWHSLQAWQRVSLVLAKKFSEVDPAHQKDYQTRAMSWRKELKDLERWVEIEMNEVPKSRRVLATTHAAFGYLCRDYGWKMIPVQGLNREQGTNPKKGKAIMEALRENKVRVLFPDESGNPKALQVVANQLGITLGPQLKADMASSVEELFHHNIGILKSTLTSTQQAN